MAKLAKKYSSEKPEIKKSTPPTNIVQLCGWKMKVQLAAYECITGIKMKQMNENKRAVLNMMRRHLSHFVFSFF